MIKRPDGVVIIGVYQLVVGFIGVLATCCLILPIAAVFSTGDSNVGFFTAISALVILFCSVAGGSIVSLVAGWGLLQLKEWARWLTIVIAVFSLFAFPIGTVIGALVIWYLFKEDVQEAFAPNAATSAMPVETQLAPPAEAEPPQPPEPPQNPESET